MFLAVTCQQASGACQSHFRPVLSLREASQKYVELSPSTLPFLTLQFHEKDLTLTPNLLQIRLILPLLGHILSIIRPALIICFDSLIGGFVSVGFCWDIFYQKRLGAIFWYGYSDSLDGNIP